MTLLIIEILAPLFFGEISEYLNTRKHSEI